MHQYTLRTDQLKSSSAKKDLGDHQDTASNTHSQSQQPASSSAFELNVYHFFNTVKIDCRQQH